MTHYSSNFFQGFTCCRNVLVEIAFVLFKKDLSFIRILAIAVLNACRMHAQVKWIDFIIIFKNDLNLKL